MLPRPPQDVGLHGCTHPQRCWAALARPAPPEQHPLTHVPCKAFAPMSLRGMAAVAREGVRATRPSAFHQGASATLAGHACIASGPAEQRRSSVGIGVRRFCFAVRVCGARAAGPRCSRLQARHSDHTHPRASCAWASSAQLARTETAALRVEDTPSAAVLQQGRCGGRHCRPLPPIAARQRQQQSSRQLQQQRGAQASLFAGPRAERQQYVYAFFVL